jgi:hypothetical protein
MKTLSNYFAVVILTIIFGCVSATKVANQETFCQRKFNHSGQIAWSMKGKPVPNGTSEELTGFRCVFDLPVNTDKADLVCEKKTESIQTCRSKEFPLEELCLNKEIQKYWEGTKLFDDHCR